jgi:hypothetical protein
MTPIGTLSAAVMLAIVAAAACAPAAGSASGPPPASAPASAASPTVALATLAPRPSVSASEAASAAPSGPCVEVADLADRGEPVVTAMAGIQPALDAGKVDDARTLAKTATKGLASMAELVGPASTAATQLFTTAATELAQAAAAFPGGSSLLKQARTDLDQAFATAETVRCSS